MRPRFPLIGSLGRQLVLAVVVGLGAGFGAVVFHGMLQLGTVWVQHAMLGLEPPEVLGEPPLIQVPVSPARPWLVFVLPAFGAFLSGWITRRFAPEAAGHGTDAAIQAYHTNDGSIPPAVPAVKAVTATLTIASGGSGGREGPIAQIGGGIGSWLASRLGLTGPERRRLMAAGMGAGVGAIFRAPLAGALFAGEILYSSALIEHEVLVPAIIASITSYSLFSVVYGWEPLFRVPQVAFRDPRELVLYAALAIAVALAGALFVWTFYRVEALFRRMSGPPLLQPLIGGLLTGAIAFWVPNAGFTGYGDIQQALLGHSSATFLLTLAALRILTTSFSIGSGGSGGVFGPSMVIGGCLGGAIGLFFHRAWPGLVPNPASFAIVGMAGFFAGIGHAPISTVVMVSEMTGNYRLLVPALWVCAISFLLTQRVSLYRKQVSSWSESGAHRHEMLAGLLHGRHAASAMHHGAVTVPRDANLGAVAQLVPHDPPLQLVVVDPAGLPVGVIESAIALASSADPVLAARIVRDLMHEHIAVVGAGAPLEEAAQRLSQPGVHVVIVTDADDGGRPVGVLTRRQLMTAYEGALRERLQLGAA